MERVEESGFLIETLHLDVFFFSQLEVENVEVLAQSLDCNSLRDYDVASVQVPVENNLRWSLSVLLG